MKKIISLLLVITMIFSMILPASAAGNGSSQNEQELIMVVTSETAPLRTKNSAKGEEIATFARGDLLKVVDCTKNTAGNYWYTVQYGETTGYMFADHLQEAHTCTMQEVAEGFRFCECGRYEMDPKGIENTGGMLATAGTFLLPEIQAALASLGTLVKGVAVASGSGVVCALLVVGGIYGVIKLSANLSATKVKVEVLSVATALKDFDELEDDAYYIARSNDRSGACKLYYWPYALDEEGACNYLTALAVAKSKPSFFFDNDNNQLTGLNGIYAKTQQSAEKLANAYDALGPMYGYGRCKSPDHKSEVNKSDQCYEHYHIFYRGVVTSSFHKVNNVHIFFDLPTLHPDYV